jgi:ribonuclease HI
VLESELLLYTDGGSLDNGGLGAIASIITNTTDQVLADGVEVIGPATNNQAEYRALLRGLQVSRQFRPRRARGFSDSELLVNQLNGLYRVRAPELKPLYARVRQFEQQMEITYRHVTREHPRIRQADRALRAAREAL